MPTPLCVFFLGGLCGIRPCPLYRELGTQVKDHLQSGEEQPASSQKRVCADSETLATLSLPSHKCSWKGHHNQHGADLLSDMASVCRSGLVPYLALKIGNQQPKPIATSPNCYDFRQLRQLSTVVVSKVRSQMSLEECKSWTCIVLLGLRAKVQVKGLSIKD